MFRELKYFTAMHNQAMRLIVALAILFTFSFTYASDVCRTSGFAGMEQNKARAEAVLPTSKTKDMKKAVVYVEYYNDQLYYHSNFVTQGHDYPTKVAGNPNKNPIFSDIETMFSNIIYDSRPDENASNEANQALNQHAQILLDVSMFDERGIPRIDLADVKNVRIVDGKNKQSILDNPEKLLTSNPPPSIIGKIKGCCLYGRPPHLASIFSEKLSEKRFEPSEIRIASLFIESATEKQLKNSSVLTKARITGDAKSLKTKEDLNKMFDRSKGKTLVLLGHVEGSNYVVRTSSNASQLSIPIAEVRAMAKAKNIKLIDIGCQTAKVIEEESFGMGVMTKYNSVEAVKSLEKSIKNSTNFEEFLSGISSEGLKIVLEPSFLKDEPIRTASIYSRIKNAGKAMWMKVAEVTFSYFG